MGNRVLGLQILKRVMHLKVAELSPRRAMEVRCSFLRIIVLRVVELTVESADKAEIPASVVVRVDTWLETVHRTEVRLGVMLGLGLPHIMQQQPSLRRGTDFMP